ncbi:MAG: 30S ribosomal protein S17e [Candidatus Bathyarchaeia archaeon]|nr:30S ribosomal protein S17e [Candidatus Bathyarchaeota archaeon A05DMB-4]MDH7595083.1 30S ribosomal protein S17e [Candidatus Bathyarchaeota archaeon]
MGKVRPEQVKKIARELVRRYPDYFSTNFEENKKTISRLARIYSPRMKNRIAGYVTRLIVIAKHAEATETGLAEEAHISEEEAE